MGLPGAHKTGLSASALKLIAIVAMLVDHAALVFLPDYYGMPALLLHMAGRITGPVMFYFIAEGYHRTQNANRYTLRLFVFAAVSYIPFVWMVSGSLPNASNWMRFNVMYTLLLGLLALRALHEVKSHVLGAVCIALCFVASFWGDWGFLAILYILVFDIFRGSFKKQAFGYALVTLTQLLPYLAGLLKGIASGQPAMAWRMNIGPLLLYAAFFIPLLLLYFYNGEKGRGGRAAKWAFYVFYPAHMLLLCALRAWAAG